MRESWLEARRAADAVWMRRLSSGTPRGRRTLGKHRAVTHGGPHVDAATFPSATESSQPRGHAVARVHPPKCCLCSSPEMLMGGLGAGGWQPPRLGEPPAPVLPAAGGAGRWGGPWQGVCSAEALAGNATVAISGAPATLAPRALHRGRRFGLKGHVLTQNHVPSAREEEGLVLCPDGPEGELQAGRLPWPQRTMSRAREDGPTGPPRTTMPMPTRAKVTIRGPEQGGPAPLGGGEGRRQGLVTGTGCSGSGWGRPRESRGGGHRCGSG